MPLDAMGTSMSMSSRRRKNNRRNHRNAAAAADENSDRPRSAPTIPAPRASCHKLGAVDGEQLAELVCAVGCVRTTLANALIDARDWADAADAASRAGTSEASPGPREKERRSAINLGTTTFGRRRSQTDMLDRVVSDASERPEMSKELRSSMKLEHTAREWARRVREQARAVADFAKEFASARDIERSGLRKHLCHLARGVASRTRGDVDRARCREETVREIERGSREIQVHRHRRAPRRFGRWRARCSSAEIAQMNARGAHQASLDELHRLLPTADRASHASVRGESVSKIRGGERRRRRDARDDVDDLRQSSRRPSYRPKPSSSVHRRPRRSDRREHDRMRGRWTVRRRRSIKSR